MSGFPTFLEPRPPEPEELDRRTDWVCEERRIERFDVRDAEFERCDLGGVLGLEARWRRCVLRECRFTGMVMPGGVFEDVRFVGCQLDLVSFREATLRRVSFENCVLREAEFEQARLDYARFTRCDLGRATFVGASCTRVELIGCELRELRSLDGLRGAGLPIDDLFALAPVMAATLGLEVLERK